MRAYYTSSVAAFLQDALSTLGALSLTFISHKLSLLIYPD